MKLPTFKSAATLSSALWLFLIILIATTPTWVIDIIASLTQVIFYGLSLVIINYVYTESSQTSRRLLAFFLLAIFLAFITDSVNFIVFHILNHINFLHINCSRIHLALIDKTLLISDYIEMFFWYIIILLFTIKLLNVCVMRKIKDQLQFKLFSLCLGLSLIVLLFLSQPEYLKNADQVTIISFIFSIIEILTFISSITGLIHSKFWGLYLLFSGLIVMVITQISALFYYSYHALEFLNLAYATGSLWIILVFLSFYYVVAKNNYRVETWFINSNTLEAKLAFSTLVISCITYLSFIILAYGLDILNKQKALYSFVFLMAYSLIAVLSAKRIAHFFSSPFQTIQENMGMLITSQNTPQHTESFEIFEFNFLQNFICDRFHERKKQDEKIKVMGSRVVQIAHDIRSPASAIMMLAKENKSLPEEQRILLHNAATRVNDIAHRILLENEKNDSNYQNNIFILTPAILSVVSEKMIRCQENNLTINVKIDDNAHLTHVKINPTEFKCLLSNLINNSIESIPENKFGNISIIVQKGLKNIMITISDNGVGISEDQLKAFNDQKFIISTKKIGFGLGLKHAKKILSDENCHLNITSKINHGTSVQITLEQAPIHCWLCDHIPLYKVYEIIILDDDNTIHSAWKQRLSSYVEWETPVKFTHFFSGIECINYINGLPEITRENILLLTDYELAGQEITGLDVIDEIKINNSILVTSYYDDNKIIKRAILSKTKILPKMIASNTPILLQETPSLQNNYADGILLDDKKELTELIQYIAKSKGITLHTYTTPYHLFDNIHHYNKDTPLFIDYDLSLPINGIEIAKKLHLSGYKKIFIATGHTTLGCDEAFLFTLLPEKMSLITVLIDIVTEKKLNELL